MTPRSKLVLMAMGGVFFFIALMDVTIQELYTGVQVVNIWAIMHWYGKMSVICFAAILLVLVIGQFNRKK